MHALLIPVPQSRGDLLVHRHGCLLLSFLLWRRLLELGQRFEQQAQLLAELPQGFEPVVSAVLVAVADEEFVEEGVDVVELGEVFFGGGEEGGGG